MDILFENRYERTKDFHKEICSYSFFKRPLMIAVYIVLALIFILCILSLVFTGIYPFDNTAGFYLPFLAIVMVVIIVRYVRAVEISHKRDLEINNGKPEESQRLIFS